jgi:hypothetical protein
MMQMRTNTIPKRALALSTAFSGLPPIIIALKVPAAVRSLPPMLSAVRIGMASVASPCSASRPSRLSRGRPIDPYAFMLQESSNDFRNLFRENQFSSTSCPSPKRKQLCYSTVPHTESRQDTSDYPVPAPSSTAVHTQSGPHTAHTAQHSTAKNSNSHTHRVVTHKIAHSGNSKAKQKHTAKHTTFWAENFLWSGFVLRRIIQGIFVLF